MKMQLKYLFLIGILLIITSISVADIRMPAIFGDGMVLLQDSEVAVWGWGDPGEKVLVKASWEGADFSNAVADETGKWKVYVKTPKSGGPYIITINGNNTIQLNNILAGEVWLCSGQSNMDWCVKGGFMNSQNARGSKVEIENANYPNIRLFKIGRKASRVPLDDCGGQWNSCNSKTIAEFSAVGYFFGRELYQKLDVPIGLIQCAWGGTPIEAWMERSVLEENVDYEPILERLDKNLKNYDASMTIYNQRLEKWQQEVEKARLEGTKEPPKTQLPSNLHKKRYPCYLYNGMVNPIVPFTIKGVIWYQGESNRDRAYQYRSLFPSMIQGWRQDWEQGDYPFYYVQIAPYKYRREYVCPELQEAQLMTLGRVKNTGMVVTTDIGNINIIHPRNKQDVGKRLALWALKKNYGFQDIVCSGPLYKKMVIEKDKIRIYFNYSENGLVVEGQRLKEFEIAGTDQKFYPAEAKIEANTVLLWSDKVCNPVAVRFGWRNAAQPNLFNADGLPASPFRTDDWPGVTYGKK